jgi:hypothetical protein
MKISEIVERVESLFPILMYQGYKIGVDPPVDGEGNVVLWPNELKLVLGLYARKAGLKKNYFIDSGDQIDSLTSAVDLPSDFLALDACGDNTSKHIRAMEQERVDGEDTIKTIKFLPNDGIENIVFPIKISYFVDLISYIESDNDLPTSIDIDLICDFLQAYVGPPNIRLIEVTESAEVELNQGDIQEYKDLKVTCEERLKDIKSLPSVRGTT